MSNESDGGIPERHHHRAVEAVRNEIALRRTIAGGAISLANLLTRPVLDTEGRRVGRVSDVVVRWNQGAPHPIVTGILARVGKGLAVLSARDVAIEQARVRLTSSEELVVKPVRGEGDIALARDVLDHQLIDVLGVQVVRAADVFLVRLPDGWELGGVDVGFWSFARRLLPRRRSCPPPHHVLDWADLQTFVPRWRSDAPDRPGSPTVAAGTIGSGIRLGFPAKDFHRLGARDVAAILSDLGRREQAQVATLVTPSAAAAALRELSPKKREALVAELDHADQARFLALLDEYGAP